MQISDRNKILCSLSFNIFFIPVFFSLEIVYPPIFEPLLFSQFLFFLHNNYIPLYSDSNSEWETHICLGYGISRLTKSPQFFFLLFFFYHDVNISSSSVARRWVCLIPNIHTKWQNIKYGRWTDLNKTGFKMMIIITKKKKERKECE